jgi:hypothetical protein
MEGDVRYGGKIARPNLPGARDSIGNHIGEVGRKCHTYAETAALWQKWILITVKTRL